MPRQNSSYKGGACKIRKRGSSSSSTSSCVLHNSRLKRAIVTTGRRGGPTTPAPDWPTGRKSPSVVSRMSESSHGLMQQGPVSARKLANALWELNNMPKKSFASRSPVSQEKERLGSSSRRRNLPMVPQRSRCNEHSHRALNLLSNGSLMEKDGSSQGFTPPSAALGTKTQLKDLRNGLTTTKDLLKLLNRIWRHEDQHPYGVSLISALRVELDQARAQVDVLLQEQKLDLKKRLIEELESEKKLRRRSERLNKRLGLELADTKATLNQAMKQLESERKSRELTERVCQEIVREIGDDKAVVERVKRESFKIKDELEKEREMLHLADVWREERVQMKLSEAKAQFEEKNAAVDELRNQLEAFLGNKRIEDERRDSVESDLQSIELNMESNSKGYTWSYATKADEGSVNVFDSVVEEGVASEELNEDEERYVSVKELRDNMLSGIGNQDSSNPVQH